MKETHAHSSSRLLQLFNLPFLYLAFQHWWSINRLWPHPPLFISVWTWGGGWVAGSHYTTPTVNFNNSPIISMTKAFSVFNSTHTWSKCKSFQNHSHSCGRKTVKVLTGGEKAFEAERKIKMTCSSRYVSLRGPNSPRCIPRTASGKGWIITWHLNFAQLSFTSLCTELVLRLEGLKLPAPFKPFSSAWNEKFLQ